MEQSGIESIDVWRLDDGGEMPLEMAPASWPIVGWATVYGGARDVSFYVIGRAGAPSIDAVAFGEDTEDTFVGFRFKGQDGIFWLGRQSARVHLNLRMHPRCRIRLRGTSDRETSTMVPVVVSPVKYLG